MAANRVPFQHAEGSMSKLKASEVAQRATEQAIQVCGGWGYISDLPVEKWYRDAKLYTIFEGTSEIQRMVIGRALGESAGEPPVHHAFPADGPPLSRQIGRGTPYRAKAGMAALKSTRECPSRSCAPRCGCSARPSARPGASEPPREPSSRPSGRPSTTTRTVTITVKVSFAPTGSPTTTTLKVRLKP